MTWHLDAAGWRDYAAGALDYAAQASVEAHVASCPHCQRQATAQRPDTDAIWARVRAEITRPARPWPLRWLRRIGVPDEDIVVLTASDNLRLPWAVAIGGALASVVAAANLGRFEDAGFLLLGPLVPVLAVLAAYDSTDPLRQLSLATPYSKLRLGLLRTFATLVVALPAMAGLSAGIPGLRELAWVWLLPSLGLTGAALIALRWLHAWQAGALIAAVWTVTVLAIDGAGRLHQIGSTAGQVMFALLAVACVAVLPLSSTAPRASGGSR